MIGGTRRRNPSIVAGPATPAPLAPPDSGCHPIMEPSSSGVIKSDGLQISMFLLLPGSPRGAPIASIPKTWLYIVPNKEDTPNVVFGQAGDA